MSSLDRRAFLGRLGALVGLAAAAPLLPAEDTSGPMRSNAPGRSERPGTPRKQPLYDTVTINDPVFRENVYDVTLGGEPIEVADSRDLEVWISPPYYRPPLAGRIVRGIQGMSIDLKPLEDALRAAATDAGPRAVALADAALTEARKIGGEAARLAAATAEEMGRMLADAAAGKIDADVAEESVLRYLDALGDLAGGSAEAAARVGIARARDYLALAADVGFALVRAGVAAAAAGL